MKQRVNISIEYGIYTEAKKTINNMSRFLEKCLANYLAYSKKAKPTKNINYEELSEEERKKIDYYIDVANTKWID